MTRPSPIDPSSLMADVAAGDDGAFRALTQTLYGPALGTAMKVMGSRAEAEDAVQTALVKLWKTADRFDPERAKVSTWFRRIVVNCCIDRKRAMKPVEDIDEIHDAASDEAGPEDATGDMMRDRRVNAAVMELPARQRAAITLFYGDGATMSEIAEALDTTPKAIEGLLARARAELARRLAPLKEELEA
ncbi:sigma-70 family RNA polymerase sigma factor [Pacificimonas sp. WHA3]|uniref:Sigma-70 family RNA polymerase sigma factor n=1 Tax=Pacificimonas pallii TaxID=2827236 RepID=A0ABS6SFV7_9SPHN|nr:sigma-70 family RNA polymerase sigma factor [Pacificimonas pallii]MBV7257289.1 sigma-70 family RNA polymerase sigma factor [Pacificimonas pallii]